MSNPELWRPGDKVLRTGVATEFGKVAEVLPDRLSVEWRDGTRSSVLLSEYNITWMAWS